MNRRTADLTPATSTRWVLTGPDGAELSREIPRAIVGDRIIDRPDYSVANDLLRRTYGGDINICWFDGVHGSRAYYTRLDDHVLLD